MQQLQKSPEYDRIVQVVKQQMKNVIGEDKQLLKLAFDSLIESLLEIRSDCNHCLNTQCQAHLH